MSLPQFVHVTTLNLADRSEQPMLVAVADISTVRRSHDAETCWLTLRNGSQVSVAVAEFDRLTAVLTDPAPVPKKEQP